MNNMAINSNETFLQEVQKKVDAIPDTLLDKLWSLKETVRKKAFLIIEKTFQNNPNILASAPMTFLKKQDVDAALSLIIATLEHEKEVSFDVLQEVYQYTLSELEIATIDENTESLEVIEHKLQLLCVLLENNINYIQDEKILNFLYDEKMRIESYEDAVKISQRLIEKDYPDWYILLWLAYKYMQEPQKAILAFHAWRNHFKTQVHIENIVITSYEIGNLELSEKWYDLWVKLFPESMGYFIEYSLTITSWEEFEILTKEILPRSSSHITKKLLESGIAFLQEELLKEQEVFLISKETDIKLALSSIFESLKIWHLLLEYSQEVQPLLYHIYQFRELLENDKEEFREIIRQFLDWFYNIDISHEENDEEEDESYNTKDKQESYVKISLEEHLYMYIQHIIRTFVSYENQGALISWVFPFLEKLRDKIPKYLQMIVNEEYISYMKEYMFREEDFLASLSVDMRAVYESLISDIDEKYWKIARRNIEFFAKNDWEIKNFENTELVWFQIIKTFIVKRITTGLSQNEAQEMLEKNNIFSLVIDKDILLLLAEVLLKSDLKALALKVFTHTHLQFQDEMSLYNILKIWYILGQKQAAESYRQILMRFEFEWNISDYVRGFIKDMKSYDDLDELNQKYVLLLEWLSKIYFPNNQENIKKAIEKFESVIDMKDPEWIWWLWKIYEVNGEFESALWYYYSAFYSQEIKNPIYLKECLKIALHIENKTAIEQIEKDFKKYFDYRGFEWEKFLYDFKYVDISQALKYFIKKINKNGFMTSFPDNLNVEIQLFASIKDLSTYENSQRALLSQVLEMFRNDFSIPSQISFLKTLSSIPQDFFETLGLEIFDLLFDWKIDTLASDWEKSKLLLAAVENFAQSITQKEIDDTMLVMIRDFYYLVVKVFEKIPGGEEYVREYMKKMDIPYLQWNFIVLSNELSSSLYH